MKRIISGISAVLIFIAMLFFPKAVFTGAADGLLLWFQVVFPTLFPFMLISGVMLAGGGLSLISSSPLHQVALLQLSPDFCVGIRWGRKYRLISYEPEILHVKKDAIFCLSVIIQALFLS